jgi:DNA repair exonuclease SbcCD nuclease subunit
MNMEKPFGLISDTHNHAWSAFAETLPTGVNSRLQQILDETVRAAVEVKRAGGDTLYHGGDLFHVRGSIAPSVLNPTRDCYKHIVQKLGVRVVINAGNHDLEGKEAARISSAITALEDVGCVVVNQPEYGRFDHMVVIPWIASIEKLKEAIEHVDPVDRAGTDLLLHAPVDGVIPGLPDHGLTAEYLASLGYRRVFSGHYHHHKPMEDGKVFSIGNLTPQTWSDVGTKAGFLVVAGDAVTWFKSHAPGFVEIDGTTDPDEVPLIADGNYVRIKTSSTKVADHEALRQFLTDAGAAGVTIIPVKDPASAPTARAGGSILKAGATLEQSIGDFITAKGFARAPDLSKLCAEILATVRSVA